MRKVKILSSNEAVKLIKDEATVATSGFVGSGLPEALTTALEERFLNEGEPKNLTLVHAAGQGNRDGSGADHFAHEGLIKRVVAGHYNLAPKLGDLVLQDKIEGYNFPQGTISQLFRDIAAKKIGTLTHVGLNTFADPRIEGGKLNSITEENLVELVEILGEERLLYKYFDVDVALIRGTYADEIGNVTLTHEVATSECTAIAQAAKNCDGIVIVQVEKVVKCGSLDPKLVKIPGIYVDAIVVTEDPQLHTQSIGKDLDLSMCGEIRAPLSHDSDLKLDAKKIIARRAALELEEDSIVNLGIGAPEYISAVANEEDISDYMTLTVEAGPVGGVPQGGARFGASINPHAILDQNIQFDFYDGSGIDLAFLGLAQVDKHGNINVSKFGPRIAGCGGFINITQNAKKVFYCGTFTAGGLKTEVEDGQLKIKQEGASVKFLEDVEQITFSGDYAKKVNQPVTYITERAVFELKKDGVHLTEIAPGVDLQSQILDLMEFEPIIDEPLKTMDLRIFRKEKMNIK